MQLQHATRQSYRGTRGCHGHYLASLCLGLCSGKVSKVKDRRRNAVHLLGRIPRRRWDGRGPAGEMGDGLLLGPVTSRFSSSAEWTGAREDDGAKGPELGADGLAGSFLFPTS